MEVASVENNFKFEEKPIPKQLYSVIAPQAIRPSSNYCITVISYKSQSVATVKVGIKGTEFEEYANVQVEPNSIKSVTIKVPNIKNDEYKIIAEEISELQLDTEKFSKEEKLSFNEKRFYVIFQTDKSTYKPGDLVRYRILILDPFLRPVKLDDKINVGIEDPQKNRVQQHKNILLTDSIYSEELQLTESPILGKWTIIAEIDGKLYKRDFNVEEYVLPKFEVTIDSPKYFWIGDEKIAFTVKAKYTFGKPVKGEVTVKFPHNKFIQHIPIDGQALVEVDLKKDLKKTLNDCFYDFTIEIEASVAEGLSDEVQSTKTSIEVRKDKVRFESVAIPWHYVIGEPFDIVFKLISYEEKPVQDTITPIYLWFTTHHDGENKLYLNEYNVDEKGLVNATITIDEDYDNLIMVAKYGNNEQTIQYMCKKLKETLPADEEVETESVNPYITAIVSSDEKSIEESEIQVEIRLSKATKEFYYQIVARGNIILSERIDVNGQYPYNLIINPTEEMVPTAKIFLHFVHKGKMIYENAKIDFKKQLRTHVEIAVPERAKPGEEIELNIKSNKNAFIGLLGIDKSATLVNNENEITVEKVLNGLQDFDVTPYYGFGLDPASSSGLITISNVILRDEIICQPMCLKRKVTKRKGFGAFEIQSESMPMLMFGGAANSQMEPEPVIVVRKEFPEVWLWEDIPAELNSTGHISHSKKLPDTITSWLISGFSLDAKHGLSLSNQSAQLEVFQPFFISMELPYSVKQGEIFELPIILFNYLQEHLSAEITLKNLNGEFEFVTNAKGAELLNETSQKKSLTVSPDAGKSVSFLIKPHKIGHMKLHVTAVTNVATDGIEKPLLVEPEGVKQYVNRPFLIDLRKQSEQTSELYLELPENVVPDSTHLFVTVIGDLLGPTLSNLDDLVRMPYGCGEQNMVNFVPNILVLKYLRTIETSISTLETKAKKFLEVGYQRELKFKHPEACYSCFGPSEWSKTGSTWLTAYVMKSFRQAADFTHVEEVVIKDGLEYLAKSQNQKGAFIEKGYSSNLPGGGDKKGIALTAFVLLAFIENLEKYPQHKEVLQKGLKYIAVNIADSDSIEVISIGAYALAAGNHEGKKSVLAILESKAKQEGLQKWWETPAKPCYWDNKTVEVTSYALLALLEENSQTLEDYVPVLRWLLAQRNDRGGYSSSYDTVLGLQALTKVAELMFSKDIALDINFNYGQNQQKILNINHDNAIVLQSHEIPYSDGRIHVNATGKGTALAQVSLKYNIKVPEPEPRFEIIPAVEGLSELSALKLSFSTRFLPESSEGETQSKMAVMEVNLPSGYVFSLSSLKSLKSTERVKKVETKKADTVIIIYFDFLDGKKITASFQSVQAHKITKQKPVAVIVYDYYNKSSQGRVFYTLPEES